MAMDISRLLGGPGGLSNLSSGFGTGSGLGGLTSATPGIEADALSTPEPDVKTTGFVGADFGDMLKTAIGALGELSAQADSGALQLAAGEEVDIHEVMLKMESASVGFQSALQVRNKLVEAYQEVMRMSI